MVFLRPEIRSIAGSQFKTSLATEMSGSLCKGSSDGNGRKTNSEEELVCSITSVASCSMVIGVGFPRLTGPVIPSFL